MPKRNVKTNKKPGPKAKKVGTRKTATTTEFITVTMPRALKLEVQQKAAGRSLAEIGRDLYTAWVNRGKAKVSKDVMVADDKTTATAVAPPEAMPTPAPVDAPAAYTTPV